MARLSPGSKASALFWLLAVSRRKYSCSSSRFGSKGWMTFSHLGCSRQRSEKPLSGSSVERGTIGRFDLS